MKRVSAFNFSASWKMGLALSFLSLLVACGGSSDSATAPVAVSNGTLVASSNQLTLYKFDNDVANSGKSVCNPPTCSVNWPALAASPGDLATGEYSIITRDDGSLQWAASGKPLYYYARDAQPGDQNGENIGTVWHVATSASTAVSVVKGVLIASRNSMTLYKFDNDVANSGRSVCNGACATRWPPLSASSTDRADGVYTIITRDDGSLQWAANGKPLYFYSLDTRIGDKNGDGVGGVWHIARP